MLVQYYYFRSLWRGKMTKARYVADLETIRSRHPEVEYEIIGPAEVRRRSDRGEPVAFGHFNPGGVPIWRTLPPPPLDNVQSDPSLREGEAVLARVFLRRHVTWCARKKRYVAMQDAAYLFRVLREATAKV